MDAPPAAASAPAALPPLEDWRPEHVEQWRLSLPENARIKFKEFFDNLQPLTDGSSLASYDLPALLLVFPKLGAYAPELYAKLQQLKRQAVSGPAPVQLSETPSGKEKRVRSRNTVSTNTLRCVWKLPKGDSDEERLLRLLGGRHHFPTLITGVAAPSVGAFAMPYYEDRPVQSLDELRVMAAHLAEAAWYLHSLGYVHCDVKRSNVRWDGQAAYLIDLDIAVCWREGDAPLPIVAGTLCWRAPELLTEAPTLTNKVDIYGLGMVCLDEMLALSYANNHWRVGRHVINTSPAGVRRLLGHSMPPADIDFVLELIQDSPSLRPTAAQVLQSSFVLKSALTDKVLADASACAAPLAPASAAMPAAKPTCAPPTKPRNLDSNPRRPFAIFVDPQPESTQSAKVPATRPGKERRSALTTLSTENTSAPAPVEGASYTAT